MPFTYQAIHYTVPVDTASSKEDGTMATNILLIDRSDPVNWRKCLYEDGWGIWRGSLDGDGIHGELALDRRSAALGSIDVTRLILSSWDSATSPRVSQLDELVLGQPVQEARLDAEAFLALVAEPQLMIPSEWRVLGDGRSGFTILADGTILRDPRGIPQVLYMNPARSGWGWSYRSLKCPPHPGEFSIRIRMAD